VISGAMFAGREWLQTLTPARMQELHCSWEWQVVRLVSSTTSGGTNSSAVCQHARPLHEATEYFEGSLLR
jgi:hypothetical protein